ncbi:MAG: helix-turn-helix transcriptional regulator [Eubacteriales bacterium]|nr:helix-turn-helix transcriptional regulator [Eubacteriales bacterium]
MSEETFQNRIKELRESTGLNRKEFCEKFDIPYRTVTEWELGHRNAPSYVLRFLEYYIRMQKLIKEKEDNEELQGDK